MSIYPETLEWSPALGWHDYWIWRTSDSYLKLGWSAHKVFFEISSGLMPGGKVLMDVNNPNAQLQPRGETARTSTVHLMIQTHGLAAVVQAVPNFPWPKFLQTIRWIHFMPCQSVSMAMLSFWSNIVSSYPPTASAVSHVPSISYQGPTALAPLWTQTIFVLWL
jgi:hypothetical protein